MRRMRSKLWRVVLGGLLLAATGCATAQPQREAELVRKRAESHFNLAADHSENGRVEASCVHDD